MPKDRKGNAIEKDDIVLIPCKVSAVYAPMIMDPQTGEPTEADDFTKANLDLTPVVTDPDKKPIHFSLKSNQVDKVT